MTRDPSSPTGRASGSAPVRRSALLAGDLRHRRHRPEPHDFGYQVWHVLVDLDELPVLDETVAGFGWNRPAPLSLRDTDHLGPLDLPLRTKLERWLAGQDVTLPDGPVLLWTGLRVFGYAFDPVSWWFCHDHRGELALVVAEVDNTFGDTHGYVLDDLERDGHDVTAAASKVFHVSPFLPIDPLRYRFRFRAPTLDPSPGGGAASGGRAGERVVAHMDVADDEGHLFDATLAEVRSALTSRALWSAVATTPWVTAKTTAAIHWQAVRLWAKGIPFVPRPEPPDAGLAAIGARRPGRQPEPSPMPARRGTLHAE